MIPGFEEGLTGSKTGEEVELNLTFPEEYSNTELAGKDARFEVSVKEVQETVLPEMNADFFAKYGVQSDNEEEFLADVKKNMERELTQAVRVRVRQQVVDGLLSLNDVEAPTSMIEQEIEKIKREAIQQFGGGQDMDLSQLPSELFQDQAMSRVKTGLLFAGIVKLNEIKADVKEVEAKIQEIASTYESPAEVIEFYAQDENRQQIAAAVAEEAVVDLVVSSAKVKKKKMSYEDAVRPAEAK
jgi:trigger factor